MFSKETTLQEHKNKLAEKRNIFKPIDPQEMQQWNSQYELRKRELFIKSKE